ncbi:oxidoreductase [Cellulomonas endometrii]|uniref:oxidoreductase n=1 Tax=Cellulomonas endometrii TaxID=3036301 RepID=UPI0024ACBAE1|nr:oxidoreductase [Cellulomonas endometrii]
MTTPRRSRFAVIGPGAIGTTIAAALHEQGRTPLVAGRTPARELRLESDQGDVVVPGPVRTDPDGVAETADVVFLAVKATQTASAAPWLAALCGPGTVVCVLQNGVEQLGTVTPLVRGAVVVPAVVWFPAVREPGGAVRLLADPRLTVPDAPGSATIGAALDGTRCAVEVAADFPTMAWRKLLQNAAAGLMAITGRRSGVFRREDMGGLTLAYLAECLAVARAEGARLGDDEPQRILDAFRASPADRGTSILADRENGRPLEWDIRNGVVQRRGRELGIPTPISDVLVPLLAATCGPTREELAR